MARRRVHERGARCPRLALRGVPHTQPPRARQTARRGCGSSRSVSRARAARCSRPSSGGRSVPRFGCGRPAHRPRPAVACARVATAGCRSRAAASPARGGSRSPPRWASPSARGSSATSTAPAPRAPIVARRVDASCRWRSDPADCADAHVIDATAAIAPRRSDIVGGPKHVTTGDAQESRSAHRPHPVRRGQCDRLSGQDMDRGPTSHDTHSVRVNAIAGEQLTRMMHKSRGKGLARPMNAGFFGPIRPCASSSQRVTMMHTLDRRLSRRCSRREGLCVRSTSR